MSRRSRAGQRGPGRAMTTRQWQQDDGRATAGQDDRRAGCRGDSRRSGRRQQGGGQAGRQPGS